MATDGYLAFVDVDDFQTTKSLKKKRSKLIISII